MSSLKRLIDEIHRRSLWQGRPRARHRSFLVCLSCLALTVLACGRGDDTAYARKSTAIISYRIGTEALSPAGDTQAKFLLFLPLVTWSEAGELEGRLARSWEHSPDYHEWTYHLRTDVRWHDGVSVTAHDVKFTLELLSHPEAVYYSPGYIDRVTVHDDSTITIRSSQFAFIDHTWVVYYPRHLLAGLDPAELSDWEFWTRPVGNGPYRFVRYMPETLWEFEANPDYFGKRPRIERVVLKVDPGGRLTELLSGNVDAIATANPSQALVIAGDPRFRLYYSPNGQVRVIYWRNDHPLFRDARVRRALTLAIDRTELQRVLSISPKIPVVDGLVAPEVLMRGDVPSALPFDPAQARDLLGDAGWVDMDGDGIRERDGREFRFTLLVRGGAGGAGGIWRRTAVFVQAQLREVGVQMDLQLLEGTIVRERLESGEFEAALDFGAAYIEWFQRTFREGSPIAYRSPEVFRLLDRLQATADAGERDGIHRTLIEAFQRDAPVTFLGPVAWTAFAHRRLRGLSTPWRSNPVAHMEELWLEDVP